MQTYLKKQHTPAHRGASAPQLGHKTDLSSQIQSNMDRTGPARGRGFLESVVPESRVNQEGVMAARGESLGPATGSLSTASAVSASGPMQAKKDKKGPPKASAPAISPDLLRRTEEDHVDPVEFAETSVDTFGSLAEKLDADELRESAGSLRDAPVFKETAGKAADVIEEAAGSNVIDIFGKTASSIGTGKAAYDAGKAIYGAAAGSGDGDRLDQTGEAAKSVLDLGESAVGTAAGFTEKITDEIQGSTASGVKIVQGSIDLANAVRHGHMANTDNIMAQNVLRGVRSGAEDRTSDEQTANDRLTESLLSAQQYAAGIHRTEAIGQGVHAGLDIMQGAASFIPTAGEAVSAGLGAAQTVSDFIFEQETNHEKKVAREANLGQEHMDMRRTLTEQLIAERKAQCAAEGRKFTMFDQDECEHLAKHTVNQRMYGKGVRTNKMASMKKTDRDVSAMEGLMERHGAGTREGELAIQRMTAAGHAISGEGRFVDRDESMGKFNADLTGQDFDTAWSGAQSQEDSKRHLVQVARAKAQKKAEAKAAEKAEKDRLKQMTPEERKAEKAKAKKAKQEKKAQQKKEKAEAKRQAKEEKIKNRSARAAQKQARKNARSQYQEEQDRFVAAGMNSEENKNLGLIDRFKKKRELKKEFKKQGEAGRIENAVEGSASAGRRNPFKEAILHAKRSHDRARDSIVTEGFEELGALDRAKIAAANPLAWIASKTKKGRAKSKANTERQSAAEKRSRELMDDILDPSKMSFEDRRRLVAEQLH